MGDSSADVAVKKWFPLESNPDTMNEYIIKLGFDASRAKFHELFALEEWALEMIPAPALAILVLFPITDRSEQHRVEEEERIKEKGQVVSSRVYYMKQTVGNACGTVGILHALGNIRDMYPPIAKSFLDDFLVKTTVSASGATSEDGKGGNPLTPEQVADILAQDEGVEAAHSEAAMEGQTRQITEDDPPVSTHFFCLVSVDGCLYELDGRKSFPINHGATSEGTFLADACGVVKDFMARDPSEVSYSVTVLAPC